MADVKWIKICTDIFDDEKMTLLDAMPERDAIIVIWFKLLCMAGKQNNGGVFMLNDKIAYTDEMLATIFRRPINIVRLALSTFEQFGMIEIVNNTYTIPNWEKHQNIYGLEKIREQNKLRKRKQREKEKLSLPCHVTVTQSHAIDIDKELDIELEKDINKKNSSKPVRHKYGEYKNVLLSDEDMEKLKAEFPADYLERIERLSGYIASTGKSYKNHLATIRNWAKKDVKGGVNSAIIRGNSEDDKFKDWQGAGLTI